MSDRYIWEDEEKQIEIRYEEEKKKKRMQNQERKKKEKLRIRKKRKRLIIKLIIVLIILFVLVAPFFKINKITIKDNVYFNANTIKNDLDFGTRVSISEMFYKKVFFKKKINYLENFHIKYDNSTKNMVIYVEEFTPLYHDINGNNYCSDQKGNVYKWDIGYSTPLIQGVKDEVVQEVAEQLEEVSYDVRLQIQTISQADEKEYGADVLKLEMYDGNTVYIYPYQIGYKMNYYNEIKQILEENKASDGNIYLYIGDYYEPYD